MTSKEWNKQTGMTHIMAIAHRNRCEEGTKEADYRMAEGDVATSNQGQEVSQMLCHFQTWDQ